MPPCVTQHSGHAPLSSSAGEEGQAALAVVQVSQKDCGFYRCVISNEYGTDSTDFLLSPEGEEPSAAWQLPPNPQVCHGAMWQTTEGAWCWAVEVEALHAP